MTFQGDPVYYDRATINIIYGSGFYIVNDLAKLYRMQSQLNKYSNFE